MGFPEQGRRSSGEAPRCVARSTTIVGANVGKQPRRPRLEQAPGGLREAARRRSRPHADYLVLNVSSPNTPGLRDLQAVGNLRPLIEAVARQAVQRPPLLVKISPDMSDEDIDAVADLALELGLAGIVATNTTLRRDGLRDAGRGGRAGRLARGRRRLRARRSGHARSRCCGGCGRGSATGSC